MGQLKVVAGGLQVIGKFMNTLHARTVEPFTCMFLSYVADTFIFILIERVHHSKFM